MSNYSTFLAPLYSLIAAPLLVSVFLVCQLSIPAAADSVTWKVDNALELQLQMATGFVWKGNPLRRALNRLAQQQQVAMMLDRRIDPDQDTDFRIDQERLELCLMRLALSQRMGVSRVGPVFYFAPPDVADKLATVAALRRDDVKRLPAPRPRQLLAKKPTGWEDLAEPSELVQTLGRDFGVEIVNAELIPHDLWPAVDLPPLSFDQALTIVLAGFQLTFELAPDGSAARLVRIPGDVQLERSYAAGSRAEALLAQLSERFPDARLSVDQGRLVVTGRWEDHHAISRLLSGRPVRRPVVRQGETRYKLSVENQPVRGLLQALAESLECALVFDERLAEDVLSQQVSFSVEDATEDQLLRAALAPIGLTYQRQGETLTILAED